MTSSRQNQLFLGLGFMVLSMLSYAAGWQLRFAPSPIPPFFADMFRAGAVVSLLCEMLSVQLFRLNSGVWRYVGIRDFSQITKAVIFSMTLFVVVTLAWPLGHYPRSVWFLDGLMTLFFFGLFRLSARLFHERFTASSSSDQTRRFLIIGAGDTGEIALRQLQQDRRTNKVLGFLDPNTDRRGLSIQGVPILATPGYLESFVEDLKISHVLIAIPSKHPSDIRNWVERCAKLEVQARILPTFRDVLSGSLNVGNIRNVALEDLLGRSPVELDKSHVSDLLSGECILVTGAGGSIGSELARQIARYAPAKLILLDHAESPLFEIDRQIRLRSPDCPIVPVLADIRDREKIDRLFAEMRPARVFHAAAYKHVPLLETHPVEAAETNVLGTEILASISERYGVRSFLMLSTDKAVDPSSVMGASKRLCERIVSCRTNTTVFCSVRFGNVLGSQGSMVPIFQQEINDGGPVHVTHEDATRYFMTIPEAVELILQAATIGQQGDIFILDMGDAIRIAEMAENMIRLSGFRPHEDIRIEFTGLRPGEKVHEKLSTEKEDLRETLVEKVQRLDHPPVEPPDLATLQSAVKAGKADAVRRALSSSLDGT